MELKRKGGKMKITNDFLKKVMPQSTEKNRLKYIDWLNDAYNTIKLKMNKIMLNQIN